MYRLTAIALINLSVLFASHAFAGLYPERAYQEKWCKDHGGRMEVVLPDRSRVDCVTATHAVEFDFATKWAEAIGQSWHYAGVLGLSPGIVLILESPSDRKYLDLMRPDTDGLRIKVWTMTPEDLR